MVLRIEIRAARTRQHDGRGDSHCQTDRRGGERRSGIVPDGRMMAQTGEEVNVACALARRVPAAWPLRTAIPPSNWIPPSSSRRPRLGSR